MTSDDLLAVALTSIDNSRSFFEEGRAQRACASCGCAGGQWQVHHVIQKQRCRRESAPLFSPDNALRLCEECHQRHTTHLTPVLLGRLRDENIAFALRWLGAGPAYEYLERYYAGFDPRVDLLLVVDR